MNGYDEEYLDDAMHNLGEAVDYAVNRCGLSADQFLNLFIASGISDSFGKGNPKYVSGLSGTELVLEILSKSGLTIQIQEPQTEYDCSAEYWSGWILAFYQWKSGRTFRNIHECIKMDILLSLYPTLHEAPEEKAAEIFEAIIQRNQTSAKLQKQRKIRGLSQRELAEKAGVNLRTMQQYELRTKDIRKASAVTVRNLANVLGCSIDDILEG